MTRLTILLFAIGLSAAPGLADDLADLRAYQYGADQAHLLAVERQVEASMADPARQRTMAKNLLEVMTDPRATLAAKQHASILLRMCGTEAEVAALAGMLGDAQLGDFARGSLERIPGPAAGKALRDALARLRGPARVGVVHSVANRSDHQAVAALVTLTAAADAEVAAAAVHALGRIGGATAAAKLKELAASRKDIAAAEAYLACGIAAMSASDKSAAADIFATLAERRYPAPVRRGALAGQLALAGDAPAMLARWLDGSDPEARRVAEQHVAKQPTAWLAASCQSRPLAEAIFFAEALAQRNDKAAIPVLVRAARQEGDWALRARGLMAMGRVGDAACVAILLDALGEEPQTSRAAAAALGMLPYTLVDPPVIEALRKAHGEQRARLLDLLEARRMKGAVSLLLELAKTDGSDDPNDDILSALATLGDRTTLQKLVGRLVSAEEGRYRDRLERTYLAIAKNHENDVGPILAAMIDDASAARLLPALGRVGGEPARRKIDEALASPDASLRSAAVRGLCNWPDAAVADQLGRLAENTTDPSVRISALRAYIRVVSLKSERSDADTLAMLQRAYGMATRVEEKRLAVERAKAVRHLSTLRWLVGLLDDDAVREEACASIVELAHHRGLRNPNRAEFVKALEKVIGTSKDPETVRRAKGYLQGV